MVSQNYFAALGVKTALGRAFSPQPDQAAAEGHSVVVSHALWQRYFGGDPSLPGKTTLLDGKEFTVIGVTPQEFQGLHQGWSPDIWVTTEGWDTMVPGEKESYASGTTAGSIWPAVFAPARNFRSPRATPNTRETPCARLSRHEHRTSTFLFTPLPRCATKVSSWDST